jgi:hypothetical protein
MLGIVILFSGCASIPPQSQKHFQPGSQMQRNEAASSVMQKSSGMKGMSSQTFEEDQNCNGKGPMLLSSHPSEPISGKIIGFVPPSLAKKLILRTEQDINGKIDPRYKDNLRAIVHPDGYPRYHRVIVIVPSGMKVQIGEEVTFIFGHASSQLACHYIPNLISAP